MGAGDVRRPEYDYARGFGALLVIFGHMTTYSRWIRSMIYTFHMPMFFLVAGLLLPASMKDGTKKDFIIKKTRGILIPALFFELLMFLWSITKHLIEREYSVSWMEKRFLGIFLQIGYSDYSGDLWFPWTFFLAMIAAYSILSHARSRYIYIYRRLVC